MNYMGYMPNDFVNGEGVSVSVWVSGCPFHCPGCHNPEAQDYKAGYTILENKIFEKLDKALTANGIERNLSILGGLPLCESNIWFTDRLIYWCRKNHPLSKIFLWTGYVYLNCNSHQKKLIDECDIAIDGPYILSLRDISLSLRGSSNQHIYKKGKRQ